VLVLQFLHEVAILLNEPKLLDKILFLFDSPHFLLLLEALRDLLPECGQFNVLLHLELAEQVADLAVAHNHPLLILPALNLCNLALDLVRAHVVLLLGQLLLHPAQVDDLAGLTLPHRDGLLHHFLELQPLLLVLLQGLVFQSLRLLLVLDELRIPVFVELTHLLAMRHLHLIPFLLEPLHQLSPSLPLQLVLHLNQSLFNGLCLHVFSCLLARLLMGEKDFPG
jgi:hypothetical protein